MHRERLVRDAAMRAMTAIPDLVEIVVGSEFDPAEARRICNAIASVSSTAAVVIDFTRVRHFQDRALFAFVSPVVGRTGLVSFRGLSLHHVRLLRYLGVPTWRELHPDDRS